MKDRRLTRSKTQFDGLRHEKICQHVVLLSPGVFLHPIFLFNFIAPRLCSVNTSPHLIVEALPWLPFSRLPRRAWAIAISWTRSTSSESWEFPSRSLFHRYEPSIKPLGHYMTRCLSSQLVVVGDQSSGKSSVLESLTGYYFPRSVGLCTRHATEIVCRREPTTSIVVTIHPFDATARKAELAKSFRHVLQDLRGGQFAEVLQMVG